VSPPAPVSTESAAQPPAPEEGELFDVAALAQTFSGKPDKMRKYALLFLDSARGGMGEIDAALAAGDQIQLSELGHRLKSSARAVGAMRFGNLCYALEQSRRDTDIDNARQLVGRMHALLLVLAPHIEQELLAYDPG
jgi:HPt (histidine-containing phosphotransfer) domain-containing protein